VFWASLPNCERCLRGNPALRDGAAVTMQYDNQTITGHIRYARNECVCRHTWFLLHDNVRVLHGAIPQDGNLMGHEFSYAFLQKTPDAPFRDPCQIEERLRPVCCKPKD